MESVISLERSHFWAEDIRTIANRELFVELCQSMNLTKQMTFMTEKEILSE